MAAANDAQCQNVPVLLTIFFFFLDLLINQKTNTNNNKHILSAYNPEIRDAWDGTAVSLQSTTLVGLCLKYSHTR